MQDQEFPEIETKLKRAGDWRPESEMPAGLERRALATQNRPPLRPIGMTRPRSVLLTTALAGAVCMVLMARLDRPMPEPSPQEAKLPDTVQKRDLHHQEMHQQIQETEMQIEESEKHFEQSHPQKQEVKKPREKTYRQKLSQNQHKQESLRPRRHSIAVDTANDSVRSGTRVAVESPAYTPAYYAQPSEDGQSVTYTPVAVALDDPDVIYSETNQEN